MKMRDRQIWLPDKEMREDFRELLTAWQTNIKRYLRLHDGDDTPWAYNERANVSLLAGAAWSRPDSCALEEYTSIKRVPGKKGSDGRSKKKTGRVDLYLRVRNGSGFACEAKQAWPLISSKASSETSVDTVIAKTRSAWRSTQALRSRTAKRRYALTFVSPRFKLPKTDYRAVSEALDRWLKDVTQRLKKKLSPQPGYSWVFPRGARLAKSPPSSGFYPGVMVVIQRQQRARPARRER